MAIDTRTPEDYRRESRNIALLLAKKYLSQALGELEYLVNATPTGDRRNALTDANITLTQADQFLQSLSLEENPK